MSMPLCMCGHGPDDHMLSERTRRTFACVAPGCPCTSYSGNFEERVQETDYRVWVGDYEVGKDSPIYSDLVAGVQRLPEFHATRGGMQYGTDGGAYHLNQYAQAPSAARSRHTRAWTRVSAWCRRRLEREYFVFSDDSYEAGSNIVRALTARRAAEAVGGTRNGDVRVLVFRNRPRWS